jgi:hypothetical protein
MRYIHSEETLEVPENGTFANLQPGVQQEDVERKTAVTRDRRPNTDKIVPRRTRAVLGDGFSGGNMRGGFGAIAKWLVADPLFRL